jgi:hypothetical protein
MRRSIALALSLCFAYASLTTTVLADVAPVDPGAGAPARFDIQIDGKLVADGESSAKITVHGFDRFGHDAAADFPVTITVANGSLVLREFGVDPMTHRGSPRLETKLGEHGTVTVVGTATTTPGDVRINALADGVVDAGFSTTTVFVAPYAKSPIVVGIATAGIGAVPGDVDGNDIFDNGNSNKGRLALYGTGTIAKQTVGTFAYESANRLDPSYAFGAYTFDPNERPYLTYGDTSTRTSDALSQGHFFGEVDRGRSSLMYGEFAAQTDAPASVGSFQQLLSGVKLHLSNDAGTKAITVFNASNDVQFGRVVFNPLGLANAGPVLEPNLIVGSEIVTLVAVDRARSFRKRNSCATSITRSTIHPGFCDSSRFRFRTMQTSIRRSSWFSSNMTVRARRRGRSEGRGTSRSGRPRSMPDMRTTRTGPRTPSSRRRPSMDRSARIRNVRRDDRRLQQRVRSVLDARADGSAFWMGTQIRQGDADDGIRSPERRRDGKLSARVRRAL